jgi:hypothetical protein
VTVQASAYVDEFGAMSYQVYSKDVSLFFGKKGEELHIGFTDESLMNLARLVNHAVCATLRARGISELDWICQEQVGR